MDMRQYRMGLIQTADQLRFSYQAIIEGAKRILSSSPDSGFFDPEQVCYRSIILMHRLLYILFPQVYMPYTPVEIRKPLF